MPQCSATAGSKSRNKFEYVLIASILWDLSQKPLPISLFSPPNHPLWKQFPVRLAWEHVNDFITAIVLGLAVGVDDFRW